MANKKKRRSKRAAVEAELDEGGEDNGEAVVAGEPATNELDLGAAIEAVRKALAPFDEDWRRRIVKSASVLLK